MTGNGGGLVVRTERVRRVRLTCPEGRAAARALEGSGALARVTSGPCTDVYLDRPGGTLARRAASVPAGATRAVLREWPGGAPLSLGLEVEQGGWLTTRTVSLLPHERQAALGPAAHERFEHLPEGVSAALAVHCQRTLLVHPEGWWVRLDEGLRPWALGAPGAARKNVVTEGVPALPLALLVLHGSGPSLPTWLTQLAFSGQKCPDLFGWEAMLRPTPPGLRLRRPSPATAAGPSLTLAGG